MKYFLAQSIMFDPLPVPAEDVPKIYIPMHEAHIAAGIAAGNVLLAGPKTEEGGGLMIARFESREALDEFLSRDPFVTNGLARFDVKEFRLTDRSENVKDW